LALPRKQQASGMLYRVQTGAFREKENALRMQEKLKAAGFDTVLVETSQ